MDRDPTTPTPEAMAALFAGYGIEESDYLAYGGANQKSIAAYLAAHPQAKQRIETLSAHIDQAIKE